MARFSYNPRDYPVRFDEGQIILAEDGKHYRADDTHDSFDFNRPGPKGHQSYKV